MILAVVEEAPDAFYELNVVEDIVKKILASISVDQSGIARPARDARDAMKGVHRYETDPTVQSLFRW